MGFSCPFHWPAVFRIGTQTSHSQRQREVLTFFHPQTIPFPSNKTILPSTICRKVGIALTAKKTHRNSVFHPSGGVKSRRTASPSQKRAEWWFVVTPPVFKPSEQRQRATHGACNSADSRFRFPAKTIGGWLFHPMTCLRNPNVRAKNSSPLNSHSQARKQFPPRSKTANPRSGQWAAPRIIPPPNRRTAQRADVAANLAPAISGCVLARFRARESAATRIPSRGASARFAGLPARCFLCAPEMARGNPARQWGRAEFWRRAKSAVLPQRVPAANRA